MKAETHEVIAAALAPVVAHQTVTQRLLAAAKARQGIPSNYRLARVLDVADTTMTRWSQGRGTAADNIAVQLAEMAGEDAGMVLVELAAERAQDEVTRNRLLGVVERLRERRSITGPHAQPYPDAVAAALAHAR